MDERLQENNTSIEKEKKVNEAKLQELTKIINEKVIQNDIKQEDLKLESVEN